jgi:hypothetical protein
MWVSCYERPIAGHVELVELGDPLVTGLLRLRRYQTRRSPPCRQFLEVPSLCNLVCAEGPISASVRNDAQYWRDRAKKMRDLAATMRTRSRPILRRNMTSSPIAPRSGRMVNRGAEHPC